MSAARFICRGAVGVALALAAVVLLAACGSSPAPTATTPASAAPSTSPSSSAPASTSGSSSATSATIITRSEAGAALGESVKPAALGHATVEGGIAAVFYGPHAPAGASADVPVYDSVRVVLVVGPKALKYFNDYRTKVHAQAIAGLGDKAYYDGSASLSVLKGDEYLRIAVIGVPNYLRAEEKLAAAAVPRM